MIPRGPGRCDLRIGKDFTYFVGIRASQNVVGDSQGLGESGGPKRDVEERTDEQRVRRDNGTRTRIGRTL
jgi:hypothetical protein